ncbi:acyltransferase family protein [Photorhabdus luminescens]|nr:acyltransferase [Photorhabdus luminescens]
MYNYDLTKNESLYLDLVRVIASQLVLVGHAISYFSLFECLHEPNFPWMQNISVVIFFILSGFVITYSINIKNKDGKYTFKLFFIDRFSRIYSGFVPAIIFIVLLDYTTILINSSGYHYFSAFNMSTFFSNLLMLQDFPINNINIFKIFEPIATVDIPTSFGSARVLWTISIEWWIYMFFGFVYFLFMNKEKFKFTYAFLFLISIVVFLSNLFDGRGNALAIFWLLGMFGCVVYPKYKETIKDVGIKAFISFIFLFLCINRQFSVISGYDSYFAFYLFLLMLSLLDLSNNINICKFKSIIKILASYSFSLYLIHYSILDFIANNFSGLSGIEKFFVGFFSSNLLAFIISRFSEVKLTRKVKDWLTA